MLRNAAASFALALGFLSITAVLPAVAACAPDASATIICTGTVTGAPGAVAVPLADGESVVNNGTISSVLDITGPTPGYGIGNFNLVTDNTVVNNGTIQVDVLSYGVFLGDQNRITNNGAITIGDAGTGISAGDGNVIDNHGTISAAAGTTSVQGLSIGAGNMVMNYGIIDVGFAGVGITGCGCTVGNTIINYGTIAAGDFGTGILDGDGSRITNSGTISVGADGTGIDVLDGIDPTIGNVTNTGTVNAGDFGIGIRAVDNYSIVNSGTINVGADGAGIVVSAFNTVVNNGNIFAGSGFSAGIAADFANVITNNGRIEVGPGGVGVYLIDTNTLTNHGTIRAGAFGVSVGVDPCGCDIAFDNIVRNHGTLDGRIYLSGAFPGDGSGNSVENWGLITITDPGTPVGASHVIDGTFIQYASGILDLRVDSAGASDMLLAESAFLAGKLRAVIQPGLYGQVTTYFSVISTCGCSGLNATTFDTVSSSSPFFSAAATYVDSGSGVVDTVDLTLTRIPFGSVPGLTDNQKAVGNALETKYDPLLPPGPAAMLFSNLLAATSTGALDALSGEGTIGTQHAAFLIGDLFTSLLSNQAFQFFQTSFGPANAAGTGFGPGALQFAPTREPDYAAFRGIKARAEAEARGRWRGWASGFGATRSLDGDAAAGSADLSQRGHGGAFGAGYLVTPDLLVGAAAGTSRSRFSSSARATSGELDAGHVGGYALLRSGDAYAAGTISYARIDNDVSRTIAGVGPSETARGSFSSDLFSARVEAGYRQSFTRVRVTPFVALQFSRLWQRGYTEASTTAAGAPGVLGLSYQPVTASSVPLFLGLMLDKRIALDGGRVLTPYVKTSWVHEFSRDRRLDASFLALPGAAFAVTGARATGDAARIETGARLTLNQTWSGFVAFDGEFGSGVRTYAGSGGFKAAW